MELFHKLRNLKLKLSRRKRPQYKVNQPNHIKPRNIVENSMIIQKGKGQQQSQRNVSKITTNSRLLNTTGNDEKPIDYENVDNIYIDIISMRKKGS